MVLGLQLQASMNVMNLPNSPPMVMKPEPKPFIDVKESLRSCNTYLHVCVYKYVPIYVPLCMHTPLSTELWIF